MYGAEEKILWFAALSRALIILLQFIFNNICPDHNADAFRSSIDESSLNSTFYDWTIDNFVGGLTRWDAQYFIHVAKYGYTSENTLAFFPLYPTCVRIVAAAMGKILFFLNQHSLIILAALTINYVLFVWSTTIFFKLSKKVLRSTSLAYKATILYCINPASIFFTAAYSETMFSYATFYAILCSMEGHRFVFFPIAISALVRSNGLINLGFPIFFGLKNWYFLALVKYTSKSDSVMTKGRTLVDFCVRTFYALINILNIIFLSLIPFVLFQIYIYVKFCTEVPGTSHLPPHVISHALKNNLSLAGSKDLSWCQARVPMAYSTVQAKYWNVGFMKYYEFKQIPNFVIAAPILFIMLRCIWQFWTEHKHNLFQFANGKRKKQENIKCHQLPIEMFVFIVHGLFLTLSCIFFVHIQVSTRLLASASPLIYWFCAAKMSFNKANIGEYEERENCNSRWKVFFLSQKSYSLADRLVLTYFLGYFVLGTFMYSNFLPWT